MERGLAAMVDSGGESEKAHPLNWRRVLLMT